MKIQEFILNLLQIAGADGISEKNLAKKLGISSYLDKQALLQVLKDMQKAKLVLEVGSRYFLPSKSPLIEGKIKRHERGFAFLIRSDGGADLFIPPKYLQGAYQGDIVLVRKINAQSGASDEAEVVKILQRGVTRLTGVFFSQKGFGFVEPDDSAFGSDIYIAKGHTLNAKTGQKVAVKIVSHPLNGSPEGVVTDVLGSPSDIEAHVKGVLIANDIPMAFPTEVLNEVQKIPEEIPLSEIELREDFTNLLTFTIDGEDARDFDDAISIFKTDSGFELYVHIADVSFYVTPNSKTDKEAYKRGTSVYIPGKVFPMLPEKLCNGLCSLNPEVKRLALTVKLCYDNNGNLIDKSFYKSIIRSFYRLTYTKVQQILNKESITENYSSDLINALFIAKELKDIMVERRNKKGTVDLGIEEFKISLTNDQLLVERKNRLESESIIEQFMISANVAVAEFIYYSELPLIYRVHGKPDGEKVSSLKNFLKACGIKVPQKMEHPMDFQKILCSITDLELKGVVSDIMLRSMQKAVYTSENGGHFGLNESCYCHFTSPIRRYPDLIAHRILKGVLEGRAYEVEQTYLPKIQEIAQNNTQSEAKADLIERQVDDLYCCEFMHPFVGDYFEGIISSVTSFGFFVRLPNCIEGLVPLEDLPKGKYEFNQDTYTLRGSKISFKIGERVIVRLNGVNYDRARVYFGLVQKI